MWGGGGGGYFAAPEEGKILVDGKEETVITCYWVTDGIDHCCMDFLKRHMVKHAWRFNGALVQVTVFSADPHCCD